MAQNMHRKVILCDSARWPFLITIPMSAFGFLLYGFSVISFWAPLFISSNAPCLFHLSLPLWGRWEAAAGEEERDLYDGSFFPVVNSAVSLQGSKGLSQYWFSWLEEERQYLKRQFLSQERPGYHPTTTFSSQCEGWVESICRCGCETGSKMCFQSLFMSSRDHTQGNWSKPEKMWELLVLPLFLFITQGAVTPRRNWNRSF